MKKIFYLLSGIILISFSINSPVSSEVPLEEEPLISLDFKDASLKDVLKVFSLQAGLNFIAAEEVEDKRLTLYLEKVPLKEAMQKIFKANNLVYELDEKARIFIVKPSGLPPVETITKIYALKYASVNSSFLKEEIDNYLREEVTGKAEPGEAATTGEEKRGITDVIKDLLSSEGKIVEDPRTNTLIITDIPAKFPLIEELIRRLDVSIPQIMLEVEMLDVNKNRLERMGIKFGDITDYPSILELTLSGASRSTKFPFSSWVNPERLTKTFSPGSLSSGDYQMLIDFIKSQTDTKILARPRILTLDNQPAEIKVTSQDAVNPVRTKDPDTGEVTTSYERMEVGISLRITPQVNLENNEITMFIIPKVANTKASKISGVYDPEERSAKTLVKVKDGETIIVGGLIHNDFSQSTTKLPILGDIPVLGALFRHKNIDTNKERELLVFITPRILKEKNLAKVSREGMALEREQVLEPEILRHKSINNLLNNFEKIR